MRFRASSTFITCITYSPKTDGSSMTTPPRGGVWCLSGSFRSAEPIFPLLSGLPGEHPHETVYNASAATNPSFVLQPPPPAKFPLKHHNSEARETIIFRAKSAPSARRGRRDFTKDFYPKLLPQNSSSSIWATAACLID